MKGEGLLALGVRRPVGMLMVFTAVVVFGFVSLGKLPFDLLPEVDYPSLTVRTTYPGAAPEDLEERVTERVEDALSTVNGVVRMRSSSRAEVSEILLEFEWGSNLAFLVQDVRERLDRVFLPQGVERPLILRYDPSLDPILRIALSSDKADLVRLRDVAEQEVERELEGLTGVAAVKVRGGLEDEIQVRVDPQKLAAYRITPELVRQRLTDENLNVPGGTVEEGAVEYVVRTLNEFRSLEEIEQLPLLLRGTTPVKLQDVATVARTHKDRDVVLRVAGNEAVEIDVFREAGANIVEVAQAVRQRLETQPLSRQELMKKAQAEKAGKPWRRGARSVEEKLPSDMRLTVLSDQSLFVKGAIDEVREAAIAGGLLAVLVCFLFLRQVGITAIIGLAIPVSIVATFGAMYVAGVSMNVMSLGGLALGIGMLVDNAIVVLESINRCREEGDPPMQAAIRGVSEVGSAVTASTLTTIAVFAPIVFVEGIAGQTFGDQSLTVVASLLLSLAVALFFIPGLAARMLRRGNESMEEGGPPRTPAPGLLPRLRAGFFRGVRLPRWWPALLILAVVSAGVAGYGYTTLEEDSLVRQKIQAMAAAAARAEAAAAEEGVAAEPAAAEPEAAPAPPKPQPGGQPAPKPQPTRGDLIFGGGLAAALLMLVIVFSEALLLLAGRLVADLTGFLFFLLRWLALAALLPVWLVLQVPALLVDWVQAGLNRSYPTFLRGALRLPVLTLLLVSALALSAWSAAGSLGRELLPEVLQGEITAEAYFPAGYPLEETDRIATGLERRLAAIDGVIESAVVSGADRESISSEEDGPHVARITVRTQPGDQARQIEERVEGEIRAVLASEPALARFQLKRPTLLALKAPLEIEVLGDDLEELELIAADIQRRVSDIPGIVDLRSSIRRGNPEVRVVLDRERLAEHGLNLGQVAQRLRLAVEGEVSSTFPEADERLDIRVRADLDSMQHVEQLRDIPINPDAERPLPLGAVASLSTDFGPSEIRHVGKRRAAVLSASLAGGGFDLGGLTDQLDQRLDGLRLPPTVTVQVTGQKQEMESALSSLSFALLLAVFLVYAVMAAQFESLLQPFIIMFSVPLAGIGAVWALKLAGTPISVVALLGGVVLAGIVVNNAIVLVDRINRNREQRGLELNEAIIEAGRARLRPILMTTFTTVLGMIPLTGWLAGLPGIGSIGSAEGTELRAPMALVVIAGLSVSTLLTLVVIPVLYRLVALATPERSAA